MQGRPCPHKDFLLLLQIRPTPLIIQCPNPGRVPRAKQAQRCRSYTRPRRAPSRVCTRESRAPSSPLYWVQASPLTLGRAGHYTEFVFDGNNRQKSSNGKKIDFSGIIILLIIIVIKVFSCMITSSSACSQVLLHFLLESNLGFCSRLEKCKEKPT